MKLKKGINQINVTRDTPWIDKLSEKRIDRSIDLNKESDKQTQAALYDLIAKAKRNQVSLFSIGILGR